MADRVERFAVLPRIHDERVSSRKRPAGIGAGERVDEPPRILRIVEVEPPLQETGQIVNVTERPHDPVPRRRHRNHPVRNQVLLSAAVVAPQPGDVADEGLDVVVRRDRVLHKAAFVKIVVGKRLDGRESLQQRRHKLHGPPVAVEMLH